MTCLGASTEVLDVMHFLRAAWPTQELRLRVLRDRATPALIAIRNTAVFARQGGSSKRQADRSGSMPNLQETYGCGLPGRVPEPGENGAVGDQYRGAWRSASGGYSDQRNDCEGWLKLNSAQNRIDVGARFATDMDGVRYASDAVAI